jgi:hypothetical protein
VLSGNILLPRLGEFHPSMHYARLALCIKAKLHLPLEKGKSLRASENGGSKRISDGKTRETYMKTNRS